MTTQARIGSIFSLFSFVLFAIKLIDHICSNKSIDQFLNIDKLSYMIYAILFFITIYWQHFIAKTLQVLIMAIESLIAFSYETDLVAGFIMMSIAIFLMFAYGVFLKHKTAKVLALAFSIYMLLLIPFDNNFMLAAEWLWIIAVFLFIGWATFKDQIEKLNKDKLKILSVAEEAASIARDAIDLQKGTKHG